MGIGENLEVLDIVQIPVVAKRGILWVQDFTTGQGWCGVCRQPCRRTGMGSRSVECVVGVGWDGRYRQGSTQLVLD